MKIEIIEGAIGCGKSSYIFESIEKSKNKNIIIVPEQFSYSTERLAAERFGGIGLNNVEVITLSRMVNRFGKTRADRYLTPGGKAMAVYKAVKSLSSDNIYYESAEKPGFCESFSEILTEFTEYMITPEILREKSKDIKSRVLAEKLSAVADIMDKYHSLIGERFYDGEEDLLHLAADIEKEHIFSGCDFWFDEFSVFLPQHYRIMEAFLKSGNVHITVNVTDDDGELYEVNKKIVKKIKRLAEKVGAECEEHKIDAPCRKIKSEELLFLLDNIDKHINPEFKAWEKPTEDISLYLSKNLYNEVTHTALSVRRLVMEEGYRYRDISVVCGNIESYRHILEAVFNDYKIPYFDDCGFSASEHPAALPVISAFDIMAENWSYSSCMRYLKSGYIFTKDEDGNVSAIDEDSIDLLENYCLKFGIRGKKVWLDDECWEKSQKGIFSGVVDEYDTFSEEELLKINSVRAEIIKPFIKLYELLKSKRKVRDLALGIFEFLKDINLCEGINEKSLALSEEGFKNEAEQIRIIWNTIISVLDDAVSVLGETVISREDFAELIKVGLSAKDISIIPVGIDRVAVSSVERSRQNRARVMFIIGAVSGAIPKETVAEGILTDNERIAFRELLSGDGMEIAENNIQKNASDRFNFFKTIFSVSDKLFISYPASDSEGNVQRASEITELFKKVFTNLKENDDLFGVEQTECLYSPESMYNYMLINYRDGGLSSDIYDWYCKNKPEKAEVIKRAGEYKKKAASISPKSAKKLYEHHTVYDASRLNEYGKCPFSYFVKYGLNAKEREIWQIRKLDLGTIMHQAIFIFSTRVENNAKTFDEVRENWLNLTKEKSLTILNEVMDEIKEKIISGSSRDENKISYIIMRMTKIVAKSAEALRKSMAAGEYAAVCYEKQFRINVKWENSSVSVKGKVDRIDMAELKEEKLAELRVVDYKTGSKNFSVVSILDKRDIQLVMYAIAAVEMYKNKDIVYAKSDYTPVLRQIVYDHMRDNPVTIKTFEEFESAAEKASRPDGLTVLDGDAGAFDVSCVERMDRNFLENGGSDIAGVDLKKDMQPTKSSCVENKDAFEILTDYVKKAVIETDREIYDGVIEINPLCEGKEKLCKYCSYDEICLYSDLYDKKRIQKATTEEKAWEIIKKEVRGE